MTEGDIETLLAELPFAEGEDGEPIISGLESAVTFEEAGIMTMNKGVVFRMTDGTEFQVTVVQSR